MTDERFTAMISYSWEDAAAAELLHEELALRGLTVFHDRCTFPASSRLAHNMADAVARCDAFVAYLTPASLYVGKPQGAPRPALDNEFVPAVSRWRRALPRQPGVPKIPIIVPLTHGLGDPRTEAPHQVLSATGEDISSLWTPVILDQFTKTITQPEAAAVAAGTVNALLEGRGVPGSDPIELLIATRGEGHHAVLLTVDATALVGGATSRPGEPADWDRLLAGLRDFQAALARATPNRRLHVVAKAHLTACFAVGRVFNQAAGWQLTVVGRHGETTLATQPRKTRADITVDPVGGSDAMTIEMDMLGGNVTDMATAWIRSSRESPVARLQLHGNRTGDLRPVDVGAAATEAATAIRYHVADLRPHTIRVFCASPAEFAVLVASRLTSLHADMQFYERDGDRYVPSLRIPATVP